MTYHLTEGPTAVAWKGFYIWENDVLYLSNPRWERCRAITTEWPLKDLMHNLATGYFAVAAQQYPELDVEEGL